MENTIKCKNKLCTEVQEVVDEAYNKIQNNISVDSMLRDHFYPKFESLIVKIEKDKSTNTDDKHALKLYLRNAHSMFHTFDTKLSCLAIQENSEKTHFAFRPFDIDCVPDRNFVPPIRISKRVRPGIDYVGFDEQCKTFKNQILHVPPILDIYKLVVLRGLVGTGKTLFGEYVIPSLIVDYLEETGLNYGENGVEIVRAYKIDFSSIDGEKKEKKTAYLNALYNWLNSIYDAIFKKYGKAYVSLYIDTFTAAENHPLKVCMKQYPHILTIVEIQTVTPASSSLLTTLDYTDILFPLPINQEGYKLFQQIFNRYIQNKTLSDDYMSWVTSVMTKIFGLPKRQLEAIVTELKLNTPLTTYYIQYKC